MREHAELKRILECLLFVANEPLSEKHLAEISECPAGEVAQALRELQEEYRERGFQPRQVAGGWQFTTRSEYALLIEKLYRPKMQQLSRAAMETLAIIAYKQPITRAEVAAIRQVEVDGVVSNLLDKKLVKEVGRRVGAGRAILYGTTDEFLAFFGLNALQDLPAPQEGMEQAHLQEEMEQLEFPELEQPPEEKGNGGDLQ